MWKFFFILVWLGLSFGLQPGLEYQYSYAGRLVTGVTEMRHQLAAVTVQADLTLQVQEDNTILMKLDNLGASDFNDDVGCYFRSPLPVIYLPLQEGADSLQKPFKVSLHNGGNAYLDVAEDEVSWVTNFRKSIVNMLPLSALWGEIRQTNFTRMFFEKEEQLMGGQCRNMYTVLRMSTEEAIGVNRLRKSNIVEDVQLMVSPSSEEVSPMLSDDLWTVTRTVNFDACSHLVEMKVNMDERNNAFISRTSGGRYVVRGNALGMRVERAEVEGGISVFTSSKTSDHIDTFTNQTLELRAIRLISNKLDLGNATLHSRSSQYEVDSFEDRGDSLPGYYKDMEERLTGILRDAADLPSIEMDIFNALKETSSSTPGNLVTLINIVVKGVSSLSYDHIENIHKRLQTNYKLSSDLYYRQRMPFKWQVQNFEKALILAGTKPAVKFILDLLEDQKNENYETRQQSVFFAQQISTSLKAPSLIPRILEYATNLSWEFDYMRKLLFLNAASLLAAKFCFGGEQRRNAYKEMYSNHESPCDADELIPTFIHYIQEDIKVTKGNSLHQLVVIQTLVNLGTPLSVEILQPIVLGTDGEEVNVRVVAMTGLSAHILPNSAFGMVHNLLMPIIVNRKEFPEVRSMAFLTLASWRPGLTWWKQMAISTWHDPSIEVANAISSLIRGFALQGGGQSEMAEMASQVVHLTRPADSVSFSHSSSIYLRNILNSDYPDKEISIVWFANTEGLLPSHVFITYQLQRLQGFSSPSKISVHQKNMDHMLDDIKDALNRFISRGITDSVRHVSELLRLLREELGVHDGRPVGSAQMLINFDDFFSIQNSEFRRAVMRILGLIGDFSYFVPWITPNNAYDKTVDSTVAYPTDMGLPSIIQYSAQSASKFTFTTERFRSEQSDYPLWPDWAVDIEVTTQISHESSVGTKTMVPWLRSTVESGINSKSNVFLPIHVNPAFYSESYQLAVRFLPVNQGDGTLVEGSNHPYTALNRGLYLSSTSLDEGEYKHIRRKNGQHFSERTRIAEWTGVSFESSWEGDVKQPSLVSVLGHDFSCLSPTYDNWEYNLTYSKEGTDTKDVTFLFTVGATVKTSIFDVNPLIKTLALGPLGDINSSSVSEDILQLKIQHREFTEDQQAGLGGDMVRALMRILQSYDIHESGVVTSLNARVSVESSVKSSFDALLTWVYDYSQEKLKYDLKLNLLEDAQGLPDETQESCLNIGLENPHILPLTTKEEFLSSDLSSSFNSEVYIGNNCEDLPVLAVQGNFSFTEEQLDKIRQKFDSFECNYHDDISVKDITTSQSYDNAEVNIQWTETFPEYWKNLGESFFHLVDKFLLGSSSGTTCNSSSEPVDSAAISIKASMDPHTSRVTVKSSFPGKDCKHEISNVSPFLGSAASTLDTLKHQFINGRNPGICTIESQGVRNFDGAIIPFTSNNCWKVAVLDVDSDSFAILVRFTTQWEVKVMMEEEGHLFEITGERVKVDAESDQSANDLFFKQDNGTLFALFSNGMAIKVSSRVEIHLPSSGRSSVLGLCGGYDGERILEMLGPNGCVFHDPELFASAWEVPGGDGCEKISLKDRKRMVTEYQNSCQKGSYLPTGNNVIHLNEINHCITWHYQEKRVGPCLCKAMTPTPTCSSGCSSNDTLLEQVPFECHQVGESTAEDANCRINSLATYYPIDCRMV